MDKNTRLNMPLSNQKQDAPSKTLDFDFELPPEMAERVKALTTRTSPSNTPSQTPLVSDELEEALDWDAYANMPTSQLASGSPKPLASFDWDVINLDIGTPNDEKTAENPSSPISSWLK